MSLRSLRFLCETLRVRLASRRDGGSLWKAADAPSLRDATRTSLPLR
ncbi:hypothetical protein [Nostoc sp.]